MAAELFEEASLDIVQDILSRVPAKHLLRLRCVCKAWKGIIDEQSFFVKSHTKKQQSSSSSTVLIRNEKSGALFFLSLDSLSHGELDVIPLEQIILGGFPRLSDELPTLSCNGLILIPHDNIKESWALWNPLLQDYHLLPPPPPETDLKSDKYETFLARCGLGYDEGSDDYKVMRVDYFYVREVNDYGYREVNDYYYRSRVYSLKSRLWRTIDDFPGGDCLGDHGAFLDGTLYWRSRDGVVALDLGTEAHRLVAPPPPSPNISNKEMWWVSLDALDGCLIWSFKTRMGAEAWVMEEDYSWTELCSDGDTRGSGSGLGIVGYLKSKGQVFFEHWEDGLRWLDIENKSWREIRISSVFCSSNSTYIPTFSLSFTQITPMSLVRLDNHHEINTSGVKREWKKAYERPKKRAWKSCGGGGRAAYRYRVRHFGE